MKKRLVVLQVIALLLLSIGLALRSWPRLSEGWAIRTARAPQLETPPTPHMGMIYVIRGDYSAANIVDRIPMDSADNIGSIYQCFDELANQHGFCAVPTGAIERGAHMELRRRGPQDAGIFIAGQRFR